MLEYYAQKEKAKNTLEPLENMVFVVKRMHPIEAINLMHTFVAY